MKLAIKTKQIDQLRLAKAPVPAFRTFEVEAQRISVTPINPKKKAVIIGPDKQLADLKEYGGYLDQPYTFCVSSPGTDSYSKFVAAWWFLQWMDEWNVRKLDRNFPYGKPVWHTLTGSYKDEFRDMARHGRNKPSAFVFSNVPHDASQVKLEKLRDLMELYSDVPRLIVTTGIDPATFFTQKLSYPLNAGLYIASRSQRISESI